MRRESEPKILIAGVDNALVKDMSEVPVFHQVRSSLQRTLWSKKFVYQTEGNDVGYTAFNHIDLGKLVTKPSVRENLWCIHMILL